MKKYKGWLILTGVLTGIALVLFAIVIGEVLLNDGLSPAWTKDVKTWGVVLACFALAVMLGVLISAIVSSKKQGEEKKLSDEELLAKYKTKRASNKKNNI